MTVSVWNDKEVIRIQPGNVKQAYGIAIDVGTTTCAGYLCNLNTMEVIATSSIMNPQCKYGEDVMARITFHMTTPDGLKRMSDDIIEGINSLIEKVDTVKIAGAFGTHVDREKALVMGLFPDCEIEQIHGVGNAAGDGCRAALLNKKKRDEANWCARNVQYLELTVEPKESVFFRSNSGISDETLALLHEKGKQYSIKSIQPFSSDEIVLAQWVNLKCRYGCSQYKANWSCPPATPDLAEIRTIFNEYATVLLLVSDHPQIIVCCFVFYKPFFLIT